MNFDFCLGHLPVPLRTSALLEEIKKFWLHLRMVAYGEKYFKQK